MTRSFGLLLLGMVAMARSYRVGIVGGGVVGGGIARIMESRAKALAEASGATLELKNSSKGNVPCRLLLVPANHSIVGDVTGSVR